MWTRTCAAPPRPRWKLGSFLVQRQVQYPTAKSRPLSQKRRRRGQERCEAAARELRIPTPNVSDDSQPAVESRPEQSRNLPSVSPELGPVRVTDSYPFGWTERAVPCCSGAVSNPLDWYSRVSKLERLVRQRLAFMLLPLGASPWGIYKRLAVIPFPQQHHVHQSSALCYHHWCHNRYQPSGRPPLSG